MTKRVFQFFSIMVIIGAVICLWFPASALIISALHDYAMPKISLEDLTIKSFIEVTRRADILDSWVDSAVIAAPVGALCSFIGWFLASSLRNLRTNADRIAIAAIFVPLLLPPNCFSFALARLTEPMGWDLGILKVIVGHTFLFLPIGLVFHLSKQRQQSEKVLKAARNLGASRLKVFWYIHWRYEREVLLSAFLVVAALSWDEPTVSFYLCGRASPFSVRVAQMMQSSFDPSLQSASAFVFCAVTLVIVFGGALQFRALRGNRRIG